MNFNFNNTSNNNNNNNRANRFPNESMKDLTDLTPRIKRHLVRVYLLLATVTSAASLGVLGHLMNFFWFRGGPFTFLSCILLLLAVTFTAPTERNLQLRVTLLHGFGLLQGINMGSMVRYSLYVDPSVVMSAVVSTALTFGSFSLAALLSERRSFIFLGGFLMTMTSVMMWSGVANLFLQSDLMHLGQLYMGVLVFVGYVVYDTQMIVERCTLGDEDIVQHAADLFTNLISLFVRLLELLTRKREDDERRDARMRRRSRQ